MNFFFALTYFTNRFEKAKRLLGWLVKTTIVIQSIFMWFGQKETKNFSDCLFINGKQANHPWINERAIEYPWVYKHAIDIKNGTVMDVGAKQGLPTTDMLLQNLNTVYTIDINATTTKSEGNLIVKRGDILNTSFEDDFFDAIIIISTLEHIGIPNRYGISSPNEMGDIQAMNEIFRILKSGGRVLATVPYGKGKSLPLNRLYNNERIKHLFLNFIIVQAQYFKFDTNYKLWLEVNEETASHNNWDNEPWYALACFYAVKPFNTKQQLL